MQLLFKAYSGWTDCLLVTPSWACVECGCLMENGELRIESGKGNDIVVSIVREFAGESNCPVIQSHCVRRFPVTDRYWCDSIVMRSPIQNQRQQWKQRFNHWCDVVEAEEAWWAWTLFNQWSLLSEVVIPPTDATYHNQSSCKPAKKTSSEHAPHFKNV